MALNKELINDIITVTSKAAISCYEFIGKNQKKNADKAATDTMRDEIAEDIYLYASSQSKYSAAYYKLEWYEQRIKATT